MYFSSDQIWEEKNSVSASVPPNMQELHRFIGSGSVPADMDAVESANMVAFAGYILSQTPSCTF